MIELVYGKIPDAARVGRTQVAALQKFHFDSAEKSIERAESMAGMANKLNLGLILILGSIGMVAAFAFSNMLAKTLSEISSALDDSSTQVSSAAGQIASSSEELSQAATEQAASLEETSASVEEMSSMININAENARKAADSSMGSQKQAEEVAKL